MFSLDNSIRIHVSDDGIGIPQKRIEELNRMLEKDEYSSDSTESSDKSGTGIGVRNVNSRIKLYFGEAYGMKFQNTLSGTVVEIVLPAVKE
jgi:sensor histidine kinase YesM